MGMFQERVGVSGGNGSAPRYVDATVDTGATYTVLPADLLQTVGVNPSWHETFVLADSRTVQLPMGEVRITIGDKGRVSPVVFGDSERYLLGATTLQLFGLIPDTTNHRLMPAPLFL